MSRQKTIIILVEGKSEREAFTNIISSLFDDYYNGLFNVEFIEEREDVTSRRGVMPRNIEEWTFKNHILPFLSKTYLTTEDIAYIIQLVDLDGVYISNECIKADVKAETVLYTEKNIKAKNKDEIIKRNERKRKNLDYLSSISTFRLKTDPSKICETPYQIFYFSTNLDHFLYGEQNLEDKKKVPYAIDFSMKVAPNEFESLLIENGELATFSMNGKAYVDSWTHIKSGEKSLQRLSNINLLIDEIQNSFFID